MLHCATETRIGKRELKKWSRQRAGVFALVASFYAAVRRGEDRSVLRDMLGELIHDLHDQFEIEEHLLGRLPDVSLEVHMRSAAQVLIELQEFLQLADSSDEPVSNLAHALDGLVIHQLRGESRLLS